MLLETSKRIEPCVASGLIILTIVAGWSSGLLPAPIAVRAQGNANVAVNPSSIASLSYTPGSTITVQVNTSNSPPFAGFEIGLFYNISILRLSGLDFSNNVFANDIFVISECQNLLNVPGSVNPCNPDLSMDGVGVVSLSLATNSGLNTLTPDGKLFSLTFTVEANGFTPLHIVRALLETSPSGSIIPTSTEDGYFTNAQCPPSGGALCLPPTVSLAAPRNVIVGTSATFDATASSSQNKNGFIMQYIWLWRNGQNIAYQTTISPKSTHQFGIVGLWTVTLTVEDNYGSAAIETLPINVVFSEANVSASIFFTAPDLNSLPTEEFQSVLQPTVEVSIIHEIVRHMEPRVVLEWVNATNTGVVPLQSIQLSLMMRPQWVVSPQWLPSTNAVHVYFASTSSLGDNPEITQASTISVFHSSEFTSVQLAIPDLNTTRIGHPLMPGQSILLSVRLLYDLVGTSQTASTYPRPYDFGASAIATQSGLSGIVASSSANSELLVTATGRGNNENHSFVIL